MSDLTALLERVRAATGPDRELDGAVMDAVDPLPNPAQTRWECISGQEFHLTVPPLSASVDAALALVERMLPGAYINVGPMFYIDGEIVKQRAIIIRPLWTKWTPLDDWFDNHEGDQCATAPLAILAALLSALIDKANSPPWDPPRGEAG